MNIKMPQMGVSGRYRMVVSRDAEMKDVKQEVEFDNLITNVGLDRFALFTLLGANNPLATTRQLVGRFVVGSGNSVPSVTDTSLDSPVAFATTDSFAESYSSNYDRGYSEITLAHQFGQGVAQGNLSEIGQQHSNIGGELFSRALILDGAGNPTTITVLPTDLLTCYYTLRMIIPKEPIVYNIDVDYDGVLTPTTVTIQPINANGVQSHVGWGPRSWTADNAHDQLILNSVAPQPPTTTSPSSNVASGIQGISGTYVPGTFQNYAVFNIGISQGNSSNIVNAVLAKFPGRWQVSFDPPLQKDNTQTMEMTFSASWGRA